MKCGGYFPICENKAKPIIIFGEGKEKFGFCVDCAKKYMETCSEEERKKIKQALLMNEAVNRYVEKVKNE